jgi:hypothetical protein
MALRRNLAAVVCLAFGSLMVVAQETKTPPLAHFGSGRASARREDGQAARRTDHGG